MTSKSLTDKLREHFLKEEQKIREVKSFWPSQSEKPLFDIYHKWMGTPETNPFEAEKQIIFSAGKMMEEALIDKLVEIGEVYKMEEGQERIDIMRLEVPITGYIDGVLKNGSPLEIKTIYGDYQIRDLQNGNPRVSYLKQLAIYMDALQQEEGVLLYMDRGRGETFEFKLVQVADYWYECGNIRFNLIDEVYKPWSELYFNHILKKVEPDYPYIYKIPVDEIDWKKETKANISKARNNHRVIGNHPFYPQYSSYKDLIIEREAKTHGKTLKEYIGYSDDELAQIKEATRGFSNWK